MMDEYIHSKLIRLIWEREGCKEAQKAECGYYCAKNKCRYCPYYDGPDIGCKLGLNPPMRICLEAENTCFQKCYNDAIKAYCKDET